MSQAGPHVLHGRPGRDVLVGVKVHTAAFLAPWPGMVPIMFQEVVYGPGPGDPEQRSRQSRRPIRQTENCTKCKRTESGRHFRQREPWKVRGREHS